MFNLDDSDQSMEKFSIRNKPSKLSFGTNLKEEEMIEKIFKEKEFLSEIPSPRCKKIKTS